jgi:hypothetical protein
MGWHAREIPRIAGHYPTFFFLNFRILKFEIQNSKFNIYIYIYFSYWSMPIFFLE